MRKLGKRGDRKGQIQISFGMIFSIIIVIFTVAIAFYVISYFLNLSKCTKIGMFYDTLDKKVNDIWAGGSITQEIFKGSVPSSVKSVCFGNLTQPARATEKVPYDYLKLRGKEDNNVFIYPPSGNCEAKIASYKLKYAITDEFFCVPAKSGVFQVKIVKGSLDSLVKLSRP